MGVPVLILGESGTGKSTSMRNFNAEELSVVNVDGKVLPFRNAFKKVLLTDDAEKIISSMQKTSSKVIVVDDAQYIMANEYMRRAKETGFTKFMDIGQKMFNIVDCVKALPADVVVYFLWHTEIGQDGTVKAKTIGKMLDEKITIEGKFTIVLRTSVEDGHYYFLTQNNGQDTVKSPMGMFEELKIDNDLKHVDSVIREYYGLNTPTGE